MTRNKVFYFIFLKMNVVKLEYTCQKFPLSSDNQPRLSAFKKYENSLRSNQSDLMNFDMEAYVNKRKLEYSFTLGQVQISGQQKSIYSLKKQQSQKFSEDSLKQIQLVDRSVSQITQFQLKKINKLKIYKVIELSVVVSENSFNNQQKQKLSLRSSVATSIITPLKFSNHINKQNYPQSFVKKQYQSSNTDQQLLSLDQILQEKSSDSQVKLEDAESYNKKIAKLKKKQQKVKNQEKTIDNQETKTSKNSNNLHNKQQKVKKQSLKQQSLNRNHGNRYSKKSSNKSNYFQQIQYNGVMRNCKCCGKLIDKLCFKCPHIYCNASNCSRKKKKELNEKMLQKMKEQKIQEHYRQRELYEKLKNKKSEMIPINEKQALNPSIQGKRNNKQLNKNNKKKKKLHQSSISYQQCQISLQEESQDIYDSSTNQENQIEQNSLNSQFQKGKQRHKIKEGIKMYQKQKNQYSSFNNLMKINNEKKVKEEESNKFKSNKKVLRQKSTKLRSKNKQTLYFDSDEE